jgi:hypothetical protein
VHWKIGGRWSWRTSFCESIDGAEGCKGGERCCEGKTTIHKSAIESITSHTGVDNCRSTTKGDGDGTMWNASGSKKDTQS